ncbi:coenzyme Q-binding protein COQ10 homolog, mitochondrial isoform X2 [Amborella trichopoda]|uniref:coenzyme Q-binding protein COQ10 homolog, mitochondrial isoform X2 n=1 Tax=Amborella trichopoda TaxID=13333 RepID=UPI0009BE7BB0|nr:coenzyme Q-binding protein COQ10 homolog, mitochondrial isoform X2 [Amborella trichopoda]|eukprot:XP_020517413.1 coenzyme Q-binding protein COQ10 homolog, mitochondrial isoform X2 [Amborella trichopoda]
MAPISFARRAVQRFVSLTRQCASVGNDSKVLLRDIESQRRLGGVRVLVSFADKLINTNKESKLANTNKETVYSFREDTRTLYHTAQQRRSFLGCGDGEEGNVLSKNYEERRVLGYSPEQLYSVVAAVDMYEDFVPWCQRSRIIRQNSDGSFDAELQTTASQSGIFDHLINIWEFNPGPVPGSCDIYFLVDFKFSSPLYRQVASMFFSEVVSRLVSSFTERCRSIYGPAVRVLENPYGNRA